MIFYVLAIDGDRLQYAQKRHMENFITDVLYKHFALIHVEGREMERSYSLFWSVDECLQNFN